MNPKNPISVVQITDIHLFADPNQELEGTTTAQSFAAVLKQVKQLQPQPNLLLLTGDLSQDETPEAYWQLRNMLSPLSIPTYWIPGNHDNLPVMQQILNQEPIFTHKIWQLGGWQFIMLNCALPGRIDGELSPQSLEWLEQQLQIASNCPTLIALHHPPLPIGSAWLDRINLRNSEDLFAVLERHPQVRLTIFGHIHQEFEQERHGINYLGTPSTCIQFKPKSPNYALEPSLPGFRLLKLYPDGNWETKVERVVYTQSTSRKMMISK